jgi:hypothetical protein
VIIFSLFFVFALAANVSAGDKQPPNISIVKPTGNYVEGSTIPFEISGADNADAIFCYLDGNPGNGKSYIGATTINSFFGQIGLTVGGHLIDCDAINDYGQSSADTPYVVKAAPTTTTTLPTTEEIPEFPTAALPAIIAAGGYLAIRRLKNKE